MVSKAAQAAAAQRASSASNAESDAWRKAGPRLEKVAAIATRKIDDMESNSKLFTKDMLDVIPKFVVDELTMGRVLGKGGFGTVKEIREIKCKAVPRAGGGHPRGFRRVLRRHRLSGGAPGRGHPARRDRPPGRCR